MWLRALIVSLWTFVAAPAAWAQLALAAVSGPLAGGSEPRPDLCRAALVAAERGAGVPDRLMRAIAVMESGRRDGAGPPVPWPWTINVEGVGEVFATKQEAIAAVTAHRARGARSIDVGCMQVNLMHHADAFATLEEAFDPVSNARYAARFLTQLLTQTGSWPLAVAGYHSLTPEIGGDYARKVMAIWARPEFPGRGGAVQLAGAPAPQLASGGVLAALPASGGVAALSASGAVAAVAPPGRIMSAGGGSGPVATGRGLDAYRAMPTRVVGLSAARHW